MKPAALKGIPERKGMSLWHLVVFFFFAPQIYGWFSDLPSEKKEVTNIAASFSQQSAPVAAKPVAAKPVVAVAKPVVVAVKPIAKPVAVAANKEKVDAVRRAEWNDKVTNDRLIAEQRKRLVRNREIQIAAIKARLQKIKRKPDLGKRPTNRQPPRIAKSKKRKTIALTGSISFTKGSLASVIHLGESRLRGYNDYNRGSSKCRKSARKNISFVTMSISNLMRLQAKGRCSRLKVFASGVWQIIPVTMKSAKAHMRFSGRDKYSHALQNRIFVEYLTLEKRPAIAHYVMTGKDISNAGLSVALEWASMQSPTYFKSGKVVCRRGTGCYDGKGTNVAHTKYTTVLKALRKARATFLKLQNQGMPHMKAYAISLGVNNL